MVRGSITVIENYINIKRVYNHKYYVAIIL